LRKTLGKICYLSKDAEIAFDHGFEIRPLHFYRDLFTSV
jgi:hypothetical protein